MRSPAILLAAFLVSAPLAADPQTVGMGIPSHGDLGLSLKAGESGGGFGTQLSYNFDAHWQAAVGVGGAGIPYLIEFGSTRTDSYYLMGKYYLRHLYFATGYCLKRTRVVVSSGGEIHTGAASAHGIPLHLGYEFGNRKGFYFAASAGLLYVFRNGDRKVMGPEQAAWSDARTAATGPSVGFTLGYYFGLLQ
jgi:hypothetical protein